MKRNALLNIIEKRIDSLKEVEDVYYPSPILYDPSMSREEIDELGRQACKKEREHGIPDDFGVRIFKPQMPRRITEL